MLLTNCVIRTLLLVFIAIGKDWILGNIVQMLHISSTFSFTETIVSNSYCHNTFCLILKKLSKNASSFLQSEKNWILNRFNIYQVFKSNCGDNCLSSLNQLQKWYGIQEVLKFYYSYSFQMKYNHYSREKKNYTSKYYIKN